MKIPHQLKHCQFNRVRFKQKRAFEEEWQKKPYTYDEIQQYFPQENYGVICNDGLRVLDDDTPDKRLFQMFTEIFGETFSVRGHLYFYFDNKHSKKMILNNGTEHLGEIQGENTYVVGAYSTHPNGELYEVNNDAEIITISYDKFMEYFDVFIKTNKTQYESEDTTEEDDLLVQQVVPEWVEGKRQELAMALSGYLRKEKRFGFNHTLNIVKRICELTEDTDFEERAKVVKQTYMKDEREIKGYQGLLENNVLMKDTPEDDIVWKENIEDWTQAKNISQRNGYEPLLFYSHYNDTIRGKPQLIDNDKKTNLNLITVYEKKKDDDEGDSNFVFIGQNIDKRMIGYKIAKLNKYFWVYLVVDNDIEYTVLSLKKLQSSEVHEFHGMKIISDNSKELSTELKLSGSTEIFLCKDFNPAIQALPKEEIIPYTLHFMKRHNLTKEQMHTFFFDLPFTHYDGNIYRQPEDYMMMRHAQLLSGKVNGYPLSTLSLGVPGCSKTMEVECLDNIFGEGVMEAGNSTVKSLVPSFKDKPASPGFIMASNRVALIDEIMKMVDKQMEGNASTSIIRNQLSQLNYLLEHKFRSVGSGNANTLTGQATAKFMAVGNPAGRKIYFSEHLNVLDESTLSRLFVWIKGFEHKKFVQSNKIVKSRNIHSYVYVRGGGIHTYYCMFRDFIINYYLTIYDSCNKFVSDSDSDRIDELFHAVLAIVPEELKNVWGARGKHHTELIIDGVVKYNRIFKQQSDDFVANEEDYKIATEILLKMGKSWSEGLR